MNHNKIGMHKWAKRTTAFHEVNGALGNGERINMHLSFSFSFSRLLFFLFLREIKLVKGQLGFILLMLCLGGGGGAARCWG